MINDLNGKEKSTISAVPSRSQTIIFRIKAALLQLKRGLQNLFVNKVKRFSFSNRLKDKSVIGESRTALWTESDKAEQFLVAGKIHNLRLAVKKLNGIEIPANEIFSFWAHVGRASRLRGFVEGRELREGCIIPNVGGGLCQLSNALYNAALQANFEVIERHAHSQVVPGSLAEKGRDATVFWNYIDLRFRSKTAFTIEAELGTEHLNVKFRGEALAPKLRQTNLVQINSIKAPSINNCATCGVGECFRSLKPKTNSNFGRAAFLVDEFSPEFDAYIRQNKRENDALFVPLDGKRFKKANYAWTTKDFAETRQSLLVTFLRSYKSRKLAAQGAQRQKALLAMYEKLAESYAKNLGYDVLHVTVHQNLLPFLWRGGYLGGRTFDVLMSSLPLENLQERLDFAYSLHPESKTLGDFRAEEWLIEAESSALQRARKIITPHTEIASFFPENAELLDWQMSEPKVLQKNLSDKPKIIFPASTVGRKGVYELREALRGLNIKLITMGANIEGEDFWNDFDVERQTNSGNWMDGASMVVLPAYIENKPRRLLQAVASGIPVIATTACGLENVASVENVAVGDAVDLREKIQKVLSFADQKNIAQVAKSSVKSLK